MFQFCPFPLSCSLAPLKRVRPHPLDIDPEDICIHILRQSEDVSMDLSIMTLGLKETFCNGSWVDKPIWVAADHAWDKHIRLLTIFFSERWHGPLCFSNSFSDERKCHSVFQEKRRCLQILDHLRAHRTV